MDFPETFITWEDTVQFKYQHDWPGDGEGEYQKKHYFCLLILSLYFILKVHFFQGR